MLGVAAVAFALAVRAALTLTVLGPDVAAQIRLGFLVMFAFLQTMYYVPLAVRFITDYFRAGRCTAQSRLTTPTWSSRCYSP